MEYQTQKEDLRHQIPEKLQQHQPTQIETNKQIIEGLSEAELDAVAGGGLWRTVGKAAGLATWFMPK